MKVDVIDNGGQWTHREWRVLTYLDVDSEIIPNTTTVDNIDSDGLVLSGGAPRIAEDDLKLGNTDDYLRELEIPILGICVGAQYIARFFGGMVGDAESPEYGKTEIEVVEEDDIFIDIPSKFTAWESHNDEVKELGDDLVILARSKTCPIQAFKHKEKEIYALQFHPEVDHTDHGVEIFENFLKVCGGKI